jgi:hypothetical protein
LHLSRERDKRPSFGQQRLWLLDQLEQEHALYGVPWGLRLAGRLNVPALERSLREIVRRHEVLRSTFTLAEGALYQVLHDPAEFSLAVTDLRSVPEASRQAQAQRLATEEAAEPFDLSQKLLVRARLLQLSDQEHWLILALHCTVEDSRSRDLFNHELAALYEAFAAQEPSPLPELSDQYADYAA